MSLEMKYVPLSFISTYNAIETQLRNTIVFKTILAEYNNIISLSELIIGTQYGFTASANIAGDHKLLRITDINNGTVDWSSVPFCYCDKDDKYVLNQGDVLIARTGNNISYLVESDVPNNAVFASYLIRIIPDKTKLLPEYLYLFLNSYAFWPQILQKQRGALLQNVNAKLMGQLLVPMCPIEIQKEIINNAKTSLNEKIQVGIGQILELFKNKNEISNELTCQLGLVKQLRQAFLREAMQGKLVPQDPNDEPASVLLEKIKEEKERLIKEKKIKKDKPIPPIIEEEIPYELPEGWVWCRLGEIANHIFDGPFGSHLKTADYTKEGILVVRLENLGFMNFKKEKKTYISIEKYETIKQHTVYEGDLIIGSFIADGVKCALLPELPSKAIAKADCFTIRLSTELLSNKFYMYLLSSELMYSDLSSLQRGMTRLRINTTQLKNQPVILPPISEQHRIVSKLDQLMQYCDQLEMGIRQSQQHNEQLLQQVLREALEG